MKEQHRPISGKKSLYKISLLLTILPSCTPNYNRYIIFLFPAEWNVVSQYLYRKHMEEFNYSIGFYSPDLQENSATISSEMSLRFP
jgi:hypothetical protein